MNSHLIYLKNEFLCPYLPYILKCEAKLNGTDNALKWKQLYDLIADEKKV